MLIKFLPFLVNRIIVIGTLGEFSEKYLDFKRKLSAMSEIIHIEPGNMKVLHKIIDPEYLEAKFDGYRLNLTEYWPPTHHTNPGDSVDEEDLASLRLVPFFITDEDYQTFVATHLPKEVVVKSRAFLGPAMNFKSRHPSLMKNIQEKPTWMLTQWLSSPILISTRKLIKRDLFS